MCHCKGCDPHRSIHRDFCPIELEEHPLMCMFWVVMFTSCVTFILKEITLVQKKPRGRGCSLRKQGQGLLLFALVLDIPLNFSTTLKNTLLAVLRPFVPFSAIKILKWLRALLQLLVYPFHKLHMLLDHFIASCFNSQMMDGVVPKMLQ